MLRDALRISIGTPAEMNALFKAIAANLPMLDLNGAGVRSQTPMSIKNLFGGFRRAPKEKSEEPAASDAQAETRWVIAGLGNPGEEYARSRHNAGFRVDRSNREIQTRAIRSAQVQRRCLPRPSSPATRALLVKPQTYYNGSGECLCRDSRLL